MRPYWGGSGRCCSSKTGGIRSYRAAGACLALPVEVEYTRGTISGSLRVREAINVMLLEV
jgi:hypothetical protein